MRVLLLGATGTVGRATSSALLHAGHQVLAPVRRAADAPPGTEVLPVGVSAKGALGQALGGQRVDGVVSCLASRSGAPDEAWAIDHRATVECIEVAKSAGATRAVLVSAICVQKPRLAFQQAKLAAEAHLMASGMEWSIVRPTALFKSLSGQVSRVQAGKPWLLFGDGQLTATKPISDRDLGVFVTESLTRDDRVNRILPIGGPGPAETPRDMSETVFRLVGRTPRFRRVPVALMSGIVGGLSLAAVLRPSLAQKAEFARIGRYYATESMLVLGPDGYDADATPEFGRDRISDHFAKLLAGDISSDLGAHSVF